VEPLRATVLVADDEPAVLELQLAILDAFGATAIGVASGAEAIETLERREFDLVVSDMKMPGGVSGRDLFAWVKEHRPALVCGFVFVTGDTVEERAFLDGAGRRTLDKPFAMDAYVAALRCALEERCRAA
jgi:CheY-like chemotaxis protein